MINPCHRFQYQSDMRILVVNAAAGMLDAAAVVCALEF